MKLKKLVIVVVLLALVLAPALLMERPVAAQSDDTVVWAFVPSENSQKVLNSADALAKLVSDKSGVKLKIVVATEFAGVIEAMCNGQAQIGALNTFGYILASSRKCADVGTRFRPLAGSYRALPSRLPRLTPPKTSSRSRMWVVTMVSLKTFITRTAMQAQPLMMPAPTLKRSTQMCAIRLL
ncbi:MAG: PhnD/SsuA/transferrin family substrate-binding protein [Spirochaetia bacterium]|nr:PhnD/SsuA/transferrin family substrate-binding protein [Spirochaetia bacterium]